MIGLSLILALDRFNLRDPLAVAVFTEVGGEPGVNYLTHFTARNSLTAEREDISIIMFS